MCLAIEYFNKIRTYDLALAFGISNPGKVGKEFVGSVHTTHVQAKTFVIAQHICKLILAKHAMIDKYTRKIAAYGAVKQHSGHRRIHTSAQAEDHTVIAECGAQFGYSAFDKRLRRPVAACSAYPYSKIFKQLHAAFAMEHLGMELHAPYTSGRCGLESGITDIGG